ncbi:MAG: hypothetical protein HUJ93_06290, partial [Bacteroidales bacterium]|nr:hypothetical protein [Bacteroidales bacterium]
MYNFALVMTLFLTGSPCKKGEDHFTSEEGFLEKVKCEVASVCRNRRRKLPRILLISAAPDDKEYNVAVFKSMRECIERSGIACSKICMLDRKLAPKTEELVADADLVFLCGGHVPTQNAFFCEIELRKILKDYKGVIIGCSAGSMN